MGGPGHRGAREGPSDKKKKLKQISVFFRQILLLSQVVAGYYCGWVLYSASDCEAAFPQEKGKKSHFQVTITKCAADKCHPNRCKRIQVKVAFSALLQCLQHFCCIAVVGGCLLAG